MNSNKLIIEEYVMGVLFAIMLLLGGLNVILRYTVNSSIPYMEDLMIPMFVWLSILGAPCACYRGANMGLSLFTDMMPKMWQKTCLIISTAVGVALFIYIFYNGTAMLISQYATKQLTLLPGFPAWVWSLCFPIGSAFYIFRTIQFAYRRFKEIKTKEV